ncbi:MAG TPA: hypothetical protein VFQ39_04795 [Longimicrobium sp.]|nr:hypothetical protein [Longimicrobium sp.]
MQTRGFAPHPPAQRQHDTHGNAFTATRPFFAPPGAYPRAPQPSAPIQRVYKDPAAPKKTLSKAQVEAYVKNADLTPEGVDYVLKRHGHKRPYHLGKILACATSVYGTNSGNMPALGTYGSLMRARSSKLRHARRALRELGGTRNFAMQKLKHRVTGKKIYLGAMSMGLGKQQLELENDPSGAQRKRSHSEAVLKAAHQSGSIEDQNNNQISLADYDPEYVTSTNEFCQGKAGQQNCHAHLAPSLTANKTAPAYVGNPYTGGSDAGLWAAIVKAHDARKKSDPTYDSEAESEDDSSTPFYFLDDRKLRAKKIKKGGVGVKAKEVKRTDCCSPY